MIPRIIEYEEGRIVITAEAYSIPEIKSLIDKYDMKAEPYLAYIYLMTAPDSPYINLPEDEKDETIIYNVIETYGNFDIYEPILKKAIITFKNLYTSTMVRKYEAAKVLHEKFTKYMLNEDITSGKDGNMSELMRILEKLGTDMRSFKDLEKQVDEELKTKMKGKAILGEY